MVARCGSVRGGGSLAGACGASLVAAGAAGGGAVSSPPGHGRRRGVAAGTRVPRPDATASHRSAPGVPQSCSDADHDHTTPTSLTTTTTAPGDSGLSGSSAVAIAIGAIVVLGGSRSSSGATPAAAPRCASGPRRWPAARRAARLEDAGQAAQAQPGGAQRRKRGRRAWGAAAWAGRGRTRRAVCGRRQLGGCGARDFRAEAAGARRHLTCALVHVEPNDRSGFAMRRRPALPYQRPPLEPHRDPIQEGHPGEALQVLGRRGREQVDVCAAGLGRACANRRGAPTRAEPRSSRASSRRSPWRAARSRRRRDDPAPLAVLDAIRGRVIGMIAGRVDAVALHQLRHVVHPRVVRAQLAQSDQAQRELGVVALVPPALAQRRDLGGDLRRVEVDALVAVKDLLGAARRRVGAPPARRRGDAGGASPMLRPPRRSPNRSPLRAEPQPEVDQAPRATSGSRACPSARSGQALAGSTPIRRMMSSMISHSWRASPRGASTGSVHWTNGVVWKVRKAQREVLALEERGGGQDVVGVSARVGDVEVDRHHQLELAAAPPPALRRSAPTGPGFPRRRTAPASDPGPAW